MNGFRLRPIEPGEWRALWEADRICFPPPQAFPQSEFRALLRVPGVFARGAAAAENGAALAGFLIALAQSAWGHVITIDVLPAWRRQGAATALLAAAEAHFRRQGTAGMRLEVAVNNHAALAFYARRGYRVQKTLARYYAPDLDGLLMECNWREQNATS